MKPTLFLLILLISLRLTAQSDTNRMKQDMTVLTKTALPRNYKNTDQLNEAATYIHNEWLPYADTVFFQPFMVGERQYTNVIASFGTQFDERIIVGAHYDVCGDQEGADDNASGITGLLELARQLDSKTLRYRVDLVAYTLEEPPFFRSEFMGSNIHAQSLIADSVNVKGMVCLEMIGYFTDARNSQDYPIKPLKMIYGSRGNYITLVNKFGPGSFARRFTKTFKHKSRVRTKRFKGPTRLPGIDFSDHKNYWAVGISAVMVTDTAFYRNKAYHQDGDQMERLDYQRMAQVIDAVLVSLNAM
jgi:Zn-dependent M28 family amino/carboxypeptidase